MQSGGVCVCSPYSLTECAAGRRAGDGPRCLCFVLFFWLFFVCFFYFVYVSLPFLRPALGLLAAAEEGKREGEKESILNFLLKRKFICSC